MNSNYSRHAISRNVIGAEDPDDVMRNVCESGCGKVHEILLLQTALDILNRYSLSRKDLPVAGALPHEREMMYSAGTESQRTVLYEVHDKRIGDLTNRQPPPSGSLHQIFIYADDFVYQNNAILGTHPLSALTFVSNLVPPLTGCHLQQ